MIKPIVSIIMPTYNRAKTIGKAIESVQKQSYKDWELIIVDDASTDNTQDIVEKFQCPQIRYMKNDKNVGANASRNRGIRMAQGKYIAFLDSDNIWNPDKLRRQLEIFSENIDMVYCAFTYFQKDVQKKIPFIEEALENYDLYLEKILAVRNVVDTSTMMIRKTLLDKIGLFDEEMPRLQDYELAIRIVQSGRVKYIDEELVNVYYTKESISGNHAALLKAIVLLLKKHSRFFKDNCGVDTQLRWGLDYCIKNSLPIVYLENYLDLCEENLFGIFPENIKMMNRTCIRILKEKYDESKEVSAEYQKSIFSQIESGEKFIIYGAGGKAKEIYRNLSGNARINLKYFVVSSRTNSEEFIDEKPIIDREKMMEVEKRDILILIALNLEHYYEVKEILDGIGYKNYVYIGNMV